MTSVLSGSGSIERSPVEQPRVSLPLRLVLYLASFIVVNLIANLARESPRAGGLPALLGRAAFCLIYVAGVYSVTLAFRRGLDRRSWEAIGLPRIVASLPALGRGLLYGLVIMAIVFSTELA